MVKKKLYSLERTLAEGRKASNVDIQMMYQCVSRCSCLVQQLTKKEADPFYKVKWYQMSELKLKLISGMILSLNTVFFQNLIFRLEESLTTQTNILQAKIEQLNGKKIYVTQGKKINDCVNKFQKKWQNLRIFLLPFLSRWSSTKGAEKRDRGHNYSQGKCQVPGYCGSDRCQRGSKRSHHNSLIVSSPVYR